MKKIITLLTAITFLSASLSGCSSAPKEINKQTPVVFGEKLNTLVSDDHLKDFEAINKHTYSKKISDGVLKIYVSNDNKIYLVNKQSPYFKDLSECQTMFEQDKSNVQYLINDSDKSMTHVNKDITSLTYGKETFRLSTIPCRINKTDSDESYYYIINVAGESSDAITSSKNIASKIGSTTGDLLMGVVFIALIPVFLIVFIIGSIFK